MRKIPLIDGLPKDFVERIHLQYQKEADQIIETFRQRDPVVRINTMKTSVEKVRATLLKNGMISESISDLPEALFLAGVERRAITDLEMYEEGEIYIQSKASQLVVKALDPQPGEKILDLCAAPGSKTTQIALLMKKEGILIANDKNRKRTYRLEDNLRQQNVDDFVELKNYPGENYPKYYPEFFDRVLIDAPCSSEARFASQDSKSTQYWSRHKVKAMAKAQKKLLDAAIQCARPGGTVVYSTCAMSPEENEAVLKKIFKKHENIFLEDISWESRKLKILEMWKGKSYPHEIQKAFRLFPDLTTESFFIAKIIKNPNG